jgi:hypothetical protein
MQGSLEQVPLPEVLQFISIGKSTGVLTLKQGSNEVTLSINQGRIINSSAIERRRRLGDLLVHRGLIKRSELRRLLTLQKTVESDKRLGEILVERELISQQSISDALRLQLEEELWAIFGWGNGDFRFDPKTADALGPPIVMIEIGPLIIEGTRRNDEWQQIRKVIPHDGLVVRPRAITGDHKLNLKLRPTEWRVLSHINGRFTIRAIVNRSTMGNFEVQYILYQFLRDGLIEIVQPAAANGTSPATHRPRAAQASTPEKAKATGILGGLLGGKSDRAGKPGQHGHGMEFISPLGLLARFVSDLFHEALQSREYQVSTRAFERNLLAQRWSLITQGYTRADLIDLEGEAISTRRMEAVLEACAFAEFTEECYQDAWEALVGTIRVLLTDLREGLGEAAATRVVREVAAKFEHATVQYHTPFSLKETLAPLQK